MLPVGLHAFPRPAHHHRSRLVHFRLLMHWPSPFRCPGVVYLHTAGHSPRHGPGTPGRFSPLLGPPERSCEAAAGSLRGASMRTELCGSSWSPLSTSRNTVVRQRGVRRDVFLSVGKDGCVCPAPQVPELGPWLGVGTQAACPLEPWTRVGCYSQIQHVLH